MDHPEFSFNHMRECVDPISSVGIRAELYRFSKLAIAFAVELGGYEQA